MSCHIDIDDLMSWLLSSRLVNLIDNEGFESSFCIRKDARGFLRSGESVFLHEWLEASGLIEEIEEKFFYLCLRGSGVDKVALYFLNIKKITDDYISMSAFLGEFFPMSELRSPVGMISGKDAVKIWLSKGDGVSDDPNNIIRDERRCLAWTDVDTGLSWISGDLFSDSSSMGGGYVSYALNELRYAGFSDWRTPTMSELETLLTEDKNEELYIKRPLSKSSYSACWSEPGRNWKTEGIHGVDFQRKKHIKFDYYSEKRLMVMAYTRCVRG